MKTLSYLVFLGLLSAAPQTLTFDGSKPGALPAGWSAVTAPDAPWRVIKDPSAPSPPYVFAQVPSDANSRHFPLAVYDQAHLQDGEVSVRFKSVSGMAGRGGGVVWRYTDPRNYYLVRANALEKNIRVYRVQNGTWTELALKGRVAAHHGANHEIPTGAWMTLRVVFKGPEFSVYFNHRRVLQATDSAITGFGKVGLWTKADSVTYFDDFHVSEK